MTAQPKMDRGSIADSRQAIAGVQIIADRGPIVDLNPERSWPHSKSKSGADFVRIVEQNDATGIQASESTATDGGQPGWHENM